jgi:hypothetical protein
VFALRYFAPRFFAPRYFAEHGGVLPPALGSIFVRVRGVDRSELVCYRDTISWSTMRGARGNCSLPFILPPGFAYAPQVGDDIEIYDPYDVRVWAGTAETVKLKFIGDDGWRVRTLNGVSYEAKFDKAAVNETKFANQNAGAIFAALYAASGETVVTLGRIDDGPKIKSLTVSNIAQGWTQLAVFAGYIWYIDYTDLTVNFHPAAAREADIALESAEDLLFESIEWGQSLEDVRTGQLVERPGTAIAPSVDTFTATAGQTDFTLAVTPAYVISILADSGLSGKAVHWEPGGALVTITPGLALGTQLTVSYADTSAAAASVPGTAVTRRTAVFTRTRTFTDAGAEQEAAAIAARFSLLPSEMVLSTDRPGVAVGRYLIIDVPRPLDAANALNGRWTVREVDAQIVPGMDNLPEPYGHFRYTLHLVKQSATAVLQGDGETTTFTLPEVPGDVSSISVYNGISDGGLNPGDPDFPPDPFNPDNPDNPYPYESSWDVGTDQVTITPAPPDFSSIAVDFTPATFTDFPADGVTTEFELPDVPLAVDAIEVWSGEFPNPDPFTVHWGIDTKDITVEPAPPDGDTVKVRWTNGRAPDAPSFVDTMDALADKAPLAPPSLGGEPDTGGGGAAAGQIYLRTATLYDLTVRDDAVPIVPVYADGSGDRLIIVLTEALSVDCDLRLNKAGAELMLFSVPAVTPVGSSIEIPILVGSPPIAPDFADLETLSLDILASGSEKSRLHGVMSVTVQWRASA